MHRLNRLRGTSSLASSALLASLAWALVACGGGVLSPGEASFRDGQYPAAKQAFLALEPRVSAWGAATRAEYCVYAGLTYQALGDDARALEWLRRARSLEDARPGLLAPEDASRLRVGLASLDLAR